MRLRKLAGATASALVFGTLAVPMIASPAQAAPATAETAVFTTPCSSTAGGRTSTTTLSGSLAVTVDGTSVSATMGGTTNFGAASLQVSKLASRFVLDIDGAAVTVSGEKTLSPTVAGDTDIALPTMAGTRTATAAPATFDVTSAEVTMTMQFGAGTYTCALPDIAPVSFPAPPKDLALTCTFGQNSFVYDTNVTLSANGTRSGKIAVTATGMEDMPNTAPAFLNYPGEKITGTLGTDLGDLTGTRTGDFKGGVKVPIPAMTGLVSGSGTPLTIKVEDFTLAVGTLASIPCTLAAPKTFAVTVAPKSQACIAAEGALPAAQAGVTTATTAAAAEAANVATPAAQVAAGTAAVQKATAAAKKASAKVKKATKAVKKAKSKSKKVKAKAKKALTKSKKANTKAKKAVTSASGQLAAAQAQLSAAQARAAAANGKVAAASAALTAAQKAVTTEC